ncbi:6-carboxytetrahydropterin synthase QueD [Pseudothermotoga sp.]|nr:6-carboxytetrahydropterin synthase QueD [Pseudothermotoga sp.]MCX7813077.1 6-carboxytetrahydropterin synthase QueD [Pseudothermotoga sp.]MDW8140479.1 6-carboxytetrahydropterin synthase QueD [Pseudothermotoga sp.]
MFFLSREFTFDAAHRLESYKGKCEDLHGHTYRVRVTVFGDVDEEGMVIDFVELKKIVNEKVLSLLDHKYLNQIIPQPTAENIARWIWDRLQPVLRTEKRRLYEVTVWETADSFVTYRGE